MFIEDQGFRFYLDDQVYSPKEDSFLLLKVLKKEDLISFDTILEVGSGSGYITISLASTMPTKTVYTTDINYQAAYLTNYNAKANDIENVHVICGSLNRFFRRKSCPRIVIFNPPYLPEDPELDAFTPKYEHQQLVGGKIGYEVASSLINNLEDSNHIIFMIISSLATNPASFKNIHTNWDVHIIESESFGFEIIWVIKLIKR
ncbi:MAG: methyltransferase [Candidatus Kariarchaeaceae archaeon]|jgi:methylase of polypeptide subunit release factors